MKVNTKIDSTQYKTQQMYPIPISLSDSIDRNTIKVIPQNGKQTYLWNNNN